jgi:hypothetical protein
LIPHPNQISFFTLLWTPFGIYMWIFLSSSVIFTVIIWKLYKIFHPKRDEIDSIGTVLFGIVAFFFSEGISYRKNTPILTLLLHILSFGFSIFGMLYQTSLVALIHQPKHESRIARVEEMVEKYENFTTDIIFSDLKKNIKLYDKINATVISYDDFFATKFHETALEQNVMIFSCDFIEAVISKLIPTRNGRLDDFYYVLPEKLFTTYEKLLSGQFSPFNDRFNEISLKVFESGVRQHWRNVLKVNHLKEVHKNSVEAEENVLLRMDDLMKVLKLTGIFWLVSFVVFCMEFVWKFLMIKIKPSNDGRKNKNSRRRRVQRNKKPQAFEMESFYFPYLE